VDCRTPVTISMIADAVAMMTNERREARIPSGCVPVMARPR
jgi:hypothetical protein